jgi:predicted nucleic acid-binding protein
MTGYDGLERAMIDTNILVYAHDVDEGHRHLRAAELVRELITGRRLVLSAQVLNEFYAVTARPRRPLRLSHDEATRIIREIAAASEVTQLTASTTLRALDAIPRHSFSIWDALIWAAALENGVSVIYTEDFQDGRDVEGVMYRNPFAGPGP